MPSEVDVPEAEIVDLDQPVADHENPDDTEDDEADDEDDDADDDAAES